MSLYIFPRLVLASWVRTVCAKSIACAREVGQWRVAGVCGRAIRARSLDGCSHEVIRDLCTVSLTYDRCYYLHGVRYVPMCVGVRFMRLTGAYVKYVRARDSCKIA